MILYLLYGPSYFQFLDFQRYLASEPSLDMYGPGGALVNELLFITLIVFFWVKFLGTPGKLLLHCRVVHAETGQPLGVGRALLRYLGYYISLLTFMLGFLWIAWDRRKQGFHDKIANSVVVVFDGKERP